MSVQLPPLLVESCHLVIVPAYPDKLKVPLLLPVQTDVLPLTVPPAAVTFTVMVAGAELVEAQDPLCTTARYWVVCVRLLYVWVVVVLLMVDQLPPLSVDISHRITLPVWPDSVNDPLLLPEQTPVLPLTVPPTDAGFTEIVAAVELAGAQLPTCTTA